jgi:hypothetical protein
MDCPEASGHPNARAAASAAAASASSDEVAVTCVDVMDRIM